MRNFLFLFLTVLLSCNPLFAQNANERTNATIAPGLSAHRNYVKNPSGFKNTLGITVSSATIARDTDTADKLDGIASLVCDASAQNGYCLFSLNTIQEGDKTGNCEFKVTYKGDASLYKLRITDTSSTLTDSSVLANVTDWTEASINYPCGSARDVRLVQTESGTGAAVNVGRVYYGKATNISSGTGYIGSPVSFTPTGSWSTNTTYTGQYKIVGNEAEFTINLALAGAPTSASLDINLPSGFVIDTAKLSLGSSSEVMGSDVQVFDNGVAGYSGQILYIGNTGSVRVAYNTVSGSLLTITSVTQAAPMTFASGDAVWMRFKVPIVGLGSNTSVSVSTNPFFTNWTAFTPTFTGMGTGSYTSAAGFWRRVGDSMQIQVSAIKDGSAGTGATAITASIPSGYTIDAAKVTCSICSLGTYGSLATAQMGSTIYASTTTVNFYDDSGYFTGSDWNASEQLTAEFTVPISGWTAPQSVVPILVGSVSSSSTGALKLEYASVESTCSADPCTITKKSSDSMTSINWASTGAYTVNYTGFTSYPICTVSSLNAASGDKCNMNSMGATSATVRCYSAGGSTLANARFTIHCIGPR